MRKLLIAAGCSSLIFFAGWAFGQTELDASRWHQYEKLDDLAVTMYVRGYTQGYTDGDSSMEKITAVLFKGAPIDSERKKLLTPQVAHVAEIEGMGKNRDVTTGKLKDAITAFYDDYHNAPICWNNALQFSVWSLNGDAPTEQELDSARKSAAENACK